jgi:hypothetical protein
MCSYWQSEFRRRSSAGSKQGQRVFLQVPRALYCLPSFLHRCDAQAIGQLAYVFLTDEPLFIPKPWYPINPRWRVGE